MRNCAAFRKITHVIFDMDGVLLDTEDQYTLGIQNVVGRFGKVFDWSVKVQAMGLPGQESAKKIVELLELPISPEEFYKLLKIEYEIVMKDIQLIPGAETIVRHLHKHDIPLAVATSSSKDSFELKAKKHKDLFTVFNHIVCGGTDPEVKRGKPEPDIFLICASRFADKPSPDKCLVFEDSPNGVKAAVAAGMQVVMIPDERVPEKLRKDTPFVLKTILDTPLEKFGLPPLTTS